MYQLRINKTREKRIIKTNIGFYLICAIDTVVTHLYRAELQYSTLYTKEYTTILDWTKMQDNYLKVGLKRSLFSFMKCINVCFQRKCTLPRENT